MVGLQFILLSNPTYLMSNLKWGQKPSSPTHHGLDRLELVDFIRGNPHSCNDFCLFGISFLITCICFLLSLYITASSHFSTQRKRKKTTSNDSSTEDEYEYDSEDQIELERLNSSDAWLFPIVRHRRPKLCAYLTRSRLSL